MEALISFLFIYLFIYFHSTNLQPWCWKQQGQFMCVCVCVFMLENCYRMLLCVFYESETCPVGHPRPLFLLPSSPCCLPVGLACPQFRMFLKWETAERNLFIIKNESDLGKRSNWQLRKGNKGIVNRCLQINVTVHRRLGFMVCIQTLVLVIYYRNDH